MSGYTDMENTQPRCGILLVPSNLSCLPSALLILILNGFGIFFRVPFSVFESYIIRITECVFLDFFALKIVFVGSTHCVCYAEYSLFYSYIVWPHMDI